MPLNCSKLLSKVLFPCMYMYVRTYVYVHMCTVGVKAGSQYDAGCCIASRQF